MIANGGTDRYDDCLDIEETEAGQLALKRLSAKDSYDRVYRIRRAVQLSLSHKILPKDQWTKMEEVSCSNSRTYPFPFFYPDHHVSGTGGICLLWHVLEMVS